MKGSTRTHNKEKIEARRMDQTTTIVGVRFCLPIRPLRKGYRESPSLCTSSSLDKHCIYFKPAINYKFRNVNYLQEYQNDAKSLINKRTKKGTHFLANSEVSASASNVSIAAPSSET
ncbi:hypothetical protein MUK42_09225 [Musa troglodytarum]|uniref:Uncharacterized protein n=1 Tax=Musa troglodytarum TaxID=320322 RepID=A0A9E7ED06_9LILI|nr:hypothetical protein MUK42_09225 [Musa troglodytarum]